MRNFISLQRALTYSFFKETFSEFGVETRFIDFENLEEASKKVIEELNEVLTEYKFGNKSRILEEVGDLIFSCVNVARLLNINPEDSLQKTTDKFIKRFKYIEDGAIKMNKKVEELDIKEMDQLWSQSKNFK